MAKKRMSPEVERAVLNMRGQAVVNAALAARGGQSRSDLVPDKEREASSPIGHGTGLKETSEERQGQIDG
jgi:hypothetical protein